MSDDLFDTASDHDPATAIKRDRWGRYPLPDPDRLNERPVPTVAYTRATTFNKTIADTFLLGLWQQRMVAVGLTMRPELYAAAAALDADDRDALNKVCADAQTAAGAKTRAQLGTAFHTFTEIYDRGQIPNVPHTLKPEFDAYVKTMANLPLVFRPEWIERVVVVRGRYQVAGKFDNIGEVTAPWELAVPTADGTIRSVTLQPGDRVIVDKKTGSDVLKFGQLEIALQLGLYANGRGMYVPSVPAGPNSYEPMPDRLRRDVAIVLHIPLGERDADGRPVIEVHPVDIARGWAFAELSHQVREARKLKNLFGTVIGYTTDDQVKLERVPDQCGDISASEGTETKRAPASGEQAVPARRVTSTSNGYPAGTRCIQCGRESTKTGNITHTRGCPGSVVDRRERAWAGPDGRDVPAPFVSGAFPVDGSDPGTRLDELPDATHTVPAHPLVEEPTQHCPGCGMLVPDPGTRCGACEPPPPAPLTYPCVGGCGLTFTEAGTWCGPCDVKVAVREATSRAELSRIRTIALASGMWSDELTQLGLARIKALGL